MAVFENIVFQVIDSVEFFKMIHKITWYKGLLTSRVFCFEVSYKIILKLIEWLEGFLVVLKIAGSSNNFEDIEIEGEDFLRNDDFRLFSSDFVMVHITENFSTDFHVDFGNSLFDGHDKLF